MNVDGETKIIGFLGSTGKSSPVFALYNRAFEALKLHYIYVPLVAIGARQAMEAVRALGIHAVGVTIPYKTAVIPFLDGLDDKAKKAGAVNVVVNHDGKLIGGNTDGVGAVLALKEVTPVKGKNVVLLGAGGAARAIVCALDEERAKVVVLNRSVGRAHEVAALVGAASGGPEDLSQHMKQTDILINATSVGMAPNAGVSPVNTEVLRNGLVVMDLVRDPPQTKLTRDAAARGCRVVLGERMLLWQAAAKFPLYTGVSAPIEVMEKTLKERK